MGQLHTVVPFSGFGVLIKVWSVSHRLSSADETKSEGLESIQKAGQESTLGLGSMMSTLCPLD